MCGILPINLDIHRVTTTDKVLTRYVVVGKSHARSHIPFIEIGRHCSQTFFFLIDALFVSQSVCFFNMIFSHFQNCIFSMLYFIKIIQDT